MSEVKLLRESLRAALLREHDLACELRRLEEAGLDRRDYIMPRVGETFPIIDEDDRLVAIAEARRAFRLSRSGLGWELWELKLFHPESNGVAVLGYQVPATMVGRT